MRLMASQMALLLYLGQDDKYQVQHDFSGHVMPLAPVSHAADSIINGTIAFLTSRPSK